MVVWFTHAAIAEETTGFLRQNSICQFCVCAQSCPTVHDPLDCSPPGFSVHGIFQARILEWVVISSSRGSSQPRDRTHVSCISCISRRVLYQQGHRGSTSHYPVSWKAVNPESSGSGMVLNHATMLSRVILSKSLNPLCLCLLLSEMGIMIQRCED